MKKKLIILSSIIIILVLTIIILLNNKTKTIEGEIIALGSNYLLVASKANEDYVIKTNNNDYEVGDKLKIEIKKINKNNVPYEATAKNIEVIEKNPTKNEIKENTTIKDNLNKDNDNKENIIEEQKDNYQEEDIINYFEELKNKIVNYNKEHDISKEIKEKFVTCIDFLFYDKAIGGKTFKELSNSTKLKILEITMYIDSKIDDVIPGYKDSISTSYQNIKYKVIELYLNTTTDICNNDKELCNNAKEGFKNLKENFGITWEVIKSLAGTGLSKLKEWYEIWRYN